MHNCRSSTTLSTKPRRAVMLLQGTTFWMHRICANIFQVAVKPQSICIKDQSKKRLQKYFFQVKHQVLLWEHFQWRKRGYWEGFLTASPHTFYSTNYLLSWFQHKLWVKKNKDLDMDLPLWALPPLGYRGTTTVSISVFIFWKGTSFSIFMFGRKSCWIQAEFLNSFRLAELFGGERRVLE